MYSNTAAPYPSISPRPLESHLVDYLGLLLIQARANARSAAGAGDLRRWARHHSIEVMLLNQMRALGRRQT